MKTNKIDIIVSVVLVLLFLGLMIVMLVDYQKIKKEKGKLQVEFDGYKREVKTNYDWFDDYYMLLVDYYKLEYEIENREQLKDLEQEITQLHIDKNKYKEIINNKNDELWYMEKLIRYIVEYTDLDVEAFELWLFQNYKEWYLENKGR